MAIRVTIFDDNKRLSRFTFSVDRWQFGFQIAGTYTDCSEIYSKIKSSQPDVILMDIKMPGINGIEAVKLVKKDFPGINVLMQTAFENDENVFEAICAGASGYILKNTPPAKILEYIVEVYQGGSPMSPIVARKVLGFYSSLPKHKQLLPLLKNTI
ncbi:MAG: response regulator transcription factor [Bacteroidetes bacterium]|nr:response regulator transcription factor [Bacteroidota bacterium]